MITPKTLLQFLLGNRTAIEKIAGSKWALLLGLLFIISAGLARNYDHHILTKELLWIGGPVGMSLFSSVFIFGFIKIFGRLKSSFATGANYLAFLRCFIMTAPLAWLYGIPVEQFAEALPATIFNFSILLIVSIWRLLLTTKVACALFNFSPRRAFPLIAIPASIEMLFGTRVQSVNIVGIMGGMRLDEADRFLLAATNTMTVGSLFLFFIAIGLAFAPNKPPPNAWEPPKQKNSASKATWALALSVIAFWLAMAIKPQRQLGNLRSFHTLIATDQFKEASKYARDCGQSGFPPHQKILRPSNSWNAPRAATLLVNHDEWPAWILTELRKDVQNWLDRIENSDRESQIYEGLHITLKGDPYFQKFAEEFFPDFDPTDYQKREKAPDDHSK